MFAKPKCINCGHEMERNTNYCPECGAPQPGARVTCRHCGAQAPASAKYCPNCSRELSQSAAPPMRENRWRPDQSELAVRVEARDVNRGWLLTELIVEPGQKAIIIADGHSAGVQEPGSYLVSDLGDTIARAVGLRNAQRVQAVLIDTEPFDLTFDTDGIFTTDPYRVGVRIRLTVRITNPSLFHTTTLRSAVRFSAADLQSYLQDEVMEVAQEWIGQRSAQDLAIRLELKEEFESHLEIALDRSLARIGVELEQVRTLDYKLIHQDRLNDVRQEYLIRATKLDEQLKGERLLFDRLTEQQLLEIARETRDVEMVERRSQVRARLRRAILSDKFGELRDEREMEQFLRQIDKDKLLEDDEWDRIQRTIQWRRDDELRMRRDALADADWARSITLEDRDRDRAHLLARLETENRYGLAQLELQRRQDLEPAQQEHERLLARRRLEGEQALESLRQEFHLAQQRREADFRREQSHLDDYARRERAIRDTQTQLSIQLQQAKTAADIARIEREQDQADAELGILLLDKMKALRRRDEEERELLRLRSKEKDMQLDLEAEERRIRLAAEVWLKQKEQENRFELEWMNALKGMAPAELAVAARDSERALILRDMQATDAMKGMSEQQILAMMSRNSPEAAAALAEIARAGAEGRLGEEQRVLYERLLEQQGQLAAYRQQEVERLERLRGEDREDRRDEREGQRRLTETQLRGMADIESARARQQPAVPPPPNVIVTGGGTTYTVGGTAGTGGAALRCPKCSEVVAEDANFCPNCRQQLRGA